VFWARNGIELNFQSLELGRIRQLISRRAPNRSVSGSGFNLAYF
jgi:hypothetical protein